MRPAIAPLLVIQYSGNARVSGSIGDNNENNNKIKIRVSNDDDDDAADLDDNIITREFESLYPFFVVPSLFPTLI